MQEWQKQIIEYWIIEQANHKREYMWIQDDSAYDQCTYLNRGLLEALRKYVLHGLVPGIDWTPFWPLLMSMYLLVTPNPVSSCLWQRLKFHPNVFCYLGGFSQANITTLHDTGYTCIYITLVLLFMFFFLHLFHFPGQPDCPPFLLSVTRIESTSF
jgi:hypothetical protein